MELTLRSTLFNYGRTQSVPVRSIMKPDPVTVTPSTPTLEAIAIMRRSKVGCLPVVENDHLVGIVTAQDFLDATARIFEQHLVAQEGSNKVD